MTKRLLMTVNERLLTNASHFGNIIKLWKTYTRLGHSADTTTTRTIARKSAQVVDTSVSGTGTMVTVSSFVTKTTAVVRNLRRTKMSDTDGSGKKFLDKILQGQEQRKSKQVLIVGDERGAATMALISSLQNRAEAVKLIDTKIAEQQVGLSVELRSTLEKFEKVEPQHAYIGTVYDDEIEQYYAVIFRCRLDHEIAKEGDPPYLVAAKKNYGFDTAKEAREESAREFPLLPCLEDDGETFSYPAYDEALARKSNIIQSADVKRAEREARRQAQYDKAHKR